MCNFPYTTPPPPTPLPLYVPALLYLCLWNRVYFCMYVSAYFTRPRMSHICTPRECVRAGVCRSRRSTFIDHPPGSSGKASMFQSNVNKLVRHSALLHYILFSFPPFPPRAHIGFPILSSLSALCRVLRPSPSLSCRPPPCPGRVRDYCVQNVGVTTR